jgi:hypothetical protein
MYYILSSASEYFVFICEYSSFARNELVENMTSLAYSYKALISSFFENSAISMFSLSTAASGFGQFIYARFPLDDFLSFLQGVISRNLYIRKKRQIGLGCIRPYKVFIRYREGK